MKYTIVWNENKTEGIILSGEDRITEAEHACDIEDHLSGGVSTLADHFREIYGEYQECTIQDGLVPTQPTDEMIEAGVEAYHQSREVGHASHEMVSFIWRAMVQEINK